MKRLFGVIMIIFILIFSFGYTQAEKTDLWSIYDSVFKKCKYVDLTHAFSPTISVCLVLETQNSNRLWLVRICPVILERGRNSHMQSMAS